MSREHFYAALHAFSFARYHEAGSGDIFAVSDEHTLIIPDKGIITEESQFTAKCRLVRDRKGALFVLCDLSTATPCKL